LNPSVYIEEGDVLNYGQIIVEFPTRNKDNEVIFLDDIGTGVGHGKISD